MATRFDSYHRPPAPDELVLVDVWPYVQQEARRQLETFYPVLDAASEKRTLGMIEHGIFNMLKRGAARYERDSIEFWNPVEGHFQPYDADYNSLMLDFMRDFKGRYQRGMQRQAAAWN